MSHSENKKIIYYGAFPNGEDGGARRTRQISNWLLEINQGMLEAFFQNKIRSILSFKALIFIPQVIKLYFQYGLSAKGLAKCLLIFNQISKFSINKSIFYIEIDKNYGVLIALVLSKIGAEFIVIPHNIEFLVPGNGFGPNFRKSKFFRDAEIDIFKNSTEVLTISEYDSAVVSCLGGKSSVLSYQPINSDLKRLELIAKKRAFRKNNNKKFLVIGSAVNPPTASAFRNFLVDISENLSKYDSQLIVVGKGTELLEINRHNITILGYVDNSLLDEVLSDVDGAVIPVVQTSGFLTRIVELQVAEVPLVIVGNYIQMDSVKSDTIHYIKSLDLFTDFLEKYFSNEK